MDYFSGYENKYGMSKATYGTLWAIIVLVIVWQICLWHQSRRMLDMISGFWEADARFCQEAGLDRLVVYFACETDWAGCRGSYLLATSGSDYILNEPVIMSASAQMFAAANWSTGRSPKHFNVHFKGLSKEAQDIFPAHQNMVFDPVCCKLTMYKGSTITAVLYKDPMNTEIDMLLKNQKHQKP
jgi:hypothetical protein